MGGAGGFDSCKPFCFVFGYVFFLEVRYDG
jgi:hypothetical protein